MLSVFPYREHLAKKTVHHFKTGFKFDPPNKITGVSFDPTIKKPKLTVKDLIKSIKNSESMYEMFEMLAWLYIQQNDISNFNKLLRAMTEIHGTPIISYGLKTVIKYYVDMGILQPAHLWLKLTNRKCIAI